MTERRAQTLGKTREHTTPEEVMSHSLLEQQLAAMDQELTTERAKVAQLESDLRRERALAKYMGDVKTQDDAYVKRLQGKLAAAEGKINGLESVVSNQRQQVALLERRTNEARAALERQTAVSDNLRASMRPMVKAKSITKGDCWEVCLASILGIKREEVPTFGDDSWLADTCEWLRGRGLSLVRVDGDATVHTYGAPLIATAAGHAVVMVDGVLWHDPDYYGLGLGQEPEMVWAIVVGHADQGDIDPRHVNSAAEMLLAAWEIEVGESLDRDAARRTMARLLDERAMLTWEMVEDGVGVAQYAHPPGNRIDVYISEKAPQGVATGAVAPSEGESETR